MAIVVNGTFDVADQVPVTLAAAAVVQPAVAFGVGGRGRVVHPTLGAYDYANTPDEVVNLDGDVLVRPIWTHTQTIGGGVDALWPGYIRDVVVTERWRNGDVGSLLGHLRQLWQLFANAPDPVSGTPVVWAPNYATARTYNVVIVDVRAGGESVTLDLRLANLGQGYAPQPVEMDLRILGYAS